MASRLRSTLPLIKNAINTSQRSSIPRILTNPEVSRNFATSAAAPPKEKKVKVPLALYGVSGNYSSALYIAASKLNILDKVESELLDFVQASKNTPTFALFMKDLSVRKDTRVNAITDICTHAKFSEITRNFLGEIKRWYNPPWFSEEIPSTPYDPLVLRQDFEKAVIKILMTDVPLGVLLSGGLDSSLVAAVASRYLVDSEAACQWGSQLHTFCVGLKNL